MGFYLFLTFITVPFVELYLLLKLGKEIGALTTLGVIVVTGALGAGLTRRQGISTLANIRAGLQQGRIPTNDIVEGALILVAGLVLLTPGFLTDTVGFLLLVPPIRRLVRARLWQWLKHRAEWHVTQTVRTPHGTYTRTERRPPGDVTVDVEGHVVEDTHLDVRSVSGDE